MGYLFDKFTDNRCVLNSLVTGGEDGQIVEIMK